jgi:hypothetical protein
MIQVGPDDVVLNLCKWPRKLTPRLPENCLPGMSSNDIYVVAVALMCVGVFWFGWPYLKQGTRRARMITGTLILCVGIGIGIFGLSIISAGEQPELTAVKVGVPLPIKVEVTGRWRDQAAASAWETIAERVKEKMGAQVEPLFKYDAKIFIVNVSKTDRVSLKFVGYSVEMPDGAPGAMIHGGVKSDGLKLSLGPQEETEGTFSVHLSAPYHSNGKHKLIIVDRISDGIARVPVLGKYPPK